MTSPCWLNRGQTFSQNWQKRRQNTISHFGGPNAPWLHPWRSKFTTCKISINLASVGYLFQLTAESLVSLLVGKLFTVSRFLLHHQVHVDVHIFKLIRLCVHSLWSSCSLCGFISHICTTFYYINNTMAYSDVCRKFSWGGHLVADGGHLYLVYTVCDVTI